MKQTRNVPRRKSARTLMVGQMTPAAARIASRTRRQRGYNWEGTIVRRFNGISGWSAYRLGSASVSLPDVLALNAESKSTFVIEAKSGTTDRLTVPPEQIERCVEWTYALEPFENRHVVLAFKFYSKKRTGRNTYHGRELREYFKEWDVRDDPVECVCMYDGTTYARDEGTKIGMDLAECALPISRDSL